VKSARPWAAAAATAALTSLVFVVVYNICNRLTGIRPDTGVWAFDWERNWPLITAMIVPYWSLDLFYVVAPFLCRTREELAVHRRRILFATVAAGICFLAIPLRFAFPRPHVEGMFAPWFSALYGFDLPHNLFPSLHITLRTLLTVLYLRMSHRSLRWLVHLWFSAIGFSTLFTWQHHLVDVLGGFWLAAITLQLFPFDETPERHPASPRLVLYYGLAALLCSQLARLSWPWTFILVWPAFSCAVAALGYAGLGHRIYGKKNGQLTWLTRILLAPLLAGQWLSWRHYRRQSPRWNAITPGVWIGALPTPEDARDAIQAGVTAVLDLTVEFSEDPAFRNLRYHHIPVLDLTAPSPAQLARCAEIIQEESQSGIIFIHCKAGYSRSAAAAGAWLLTTGRADGVEAVVRQLTATRPGIVIRPEVRAALHAMGKPQRE
jgi:membrane-associated phospholipid phosphatase